MNETASGNTMIAVQKIFNLKGSANTLGDVKLAQGQQSAEKDLKRPLANTVNKMFADLYHGRLQQIGRKESDWRD